MKNYNATVYEIMDGKVVGTFVAQVDEEGRMLRSNWLQCTRYDGTYLYGEYLKLAFPDRTFDIVRDNCEGYKNAIRGLALPPAYQK